MKKFIEGNFIYTLPFNMAALTAGAYFTNDERGFVVGFMFTLISIVITIIEKFAGRKN